MLAPKSHNQGQVVEEVSLGSEVDTQPTFNGMASDDPHAVKAFSAIPAGSLFDAPSVRSSSHCE